MLYALKILSYLFLGFALSQIVWFIGLESKVAFWIFLALWAIIKVVFFIMKPKDPEKKHKFARKISNLIFIAIFALIFIVFNIIGFACPNQRLAAEDCKVTKICKLTPRDVKFDVPPSVITRVAPVYPEAAREFGIEGAVILDVEILKTGEVGKIKVLRSLCPYFDKAAKTAIKQWEFGPAQKDGKPVKSWFRQQIAFEIN